MRKRTSGRPTSCRRRPTTTAPGSTPSDAGCSTAARPWFASLDELPAPGDDVATTIGRAPVVVDDEIPGFGAWFWCPLSGQSWLGLDSGAVVPGALLVLSRVDRPTTDEDDLHIGMYL